MPSAAVLSPIVLPLAAASVIAAFGVAHVDVGRIVASAGAWLVVASLAGVWIPIRSSQELVLGQLGFGSAFDVRMDAVAFAFGLMVAAPAALLLTLQRRTWQEAAQAMLLVAAALAAVEAGGVVLTAIAGGTAATLVVVLLETQDPRASRPSWAVLLAGWLALAWVGVLLQVGGGTAVYSAVPVSSVTPAVFGLLTASAILVSGLLPWRTWPARLWSRPALSATAISVAAIYPLGFYLLVRGYELGDGHYPQLWFHVSIALLGVCLALAAALRAQAAGSRREFYSEVVPAFGGLALMSIAIGTPLGLASGLVVLATGALLVACLALVPDRLGVASFVAIGAAAGLPPGVAFGSRVLGVEATFEAGDFTGLIGLAGVASWAMWIAASARAMGLPDAAPSRAGEVFPRVATGVALLTIVAGPALAAFEYGYANPVAAAVMQAPASALATRFSVVQTTSSVLPALALFLPLLVFGVLAYPGIGAMRPAEQARPPLLKLHTPGWWLRARAVAGAARVPEQYRSIVNPRELEAAASKGRPLLWAAALVALAFAVTR